MNLFLTYNKNKPYTTFLTYAKRTAFRTGREQFYNT